MKSFRKTVVATPDEKVLQIRFMLFPEQKIRHLMSFPTAMIFSDYLLH